MQLMAAKRGNPSGGAPRSPMFYAAGPVIRSPSHSVSVAVRSALVCALLGLVACAGDREPDAAAGAGGSRAGSSAAGTGGRHDLNDAGLEPCTSCGSCSEQLPVTSWTHVPGPIVYPDPPPVGGNHDPCWAPWGIHEDEVPARNWVHNLEHGGVVFLHHCPDGCAADLEAFENLARRNERTLLTAYPELPARFALVAWGNRLVSDCLDIAAFQAFYDAHFDHGLESIGSGPPASCPQ